MSNENEPLAIDGGSPVRDTNSNPWPAWPHVSEEEWHRRVEPVLRRVYLSGTEGLPGPEAKSFAARFAQHCGARQGQLVVHGTDAIQAALSGALELHAWDDGGDVIVPNYSFIATASAALDRRCTLTFVDIDPETFTIDPDAAERAIQPGRTRAILPVHIMGHPADMSRINAIAKAHDLVVIEDAAQAHGARTVDGPVGSLGHAAAFSFQSSKNLTSGEGGMVTTNDAEIYARVAAFMDVGRHPRGQRWSYPRLGWNHRPSEYVAALLNVRLDDLEAQMAHRTRMAELLTKRLEAIPGLTTPQVGPWCTRHAYHLYALLVDPAAFGGRGRDQIVAALGAEGIPCTSGYETPLSETDALQWQRQRYPQTIRVLDHPNALHVCAHSLWLFQSMLLGSEADMADVVTAIKKIQSIWGSRPAGATNAEAASTSAKTTLPSPYTTTTVIPPT